MPIVLTSIQRRLDRLRIAEFADLSSRDSPNLLFNVMGFAQAPATFDPRRWAHGAVSFGPSLRLDRGRRRHAAGLGRIQWGGGHRHP